MAVALWSAAIRAVMDLQDFTRECPEESAAARDLFVDDHRAAVESLIAALKDK